MNESVSKSPEFALYHANAKGTGCAVKVKFHPWDVEKVREPFVSIEFAPQKSLEQGGQFAQFDWAHSLPVKFDFHDLTVMLQVLRGEIESVNDNRGFLQVTQIAKTTIRFRHTLEPVSGYAFEVYRELRAPNAGEEVERRAYFYLKPSEALGIACAIEYALAHIVFPNID